jgi:hypothetical protein
VIDPEMAFGEDAPLLHEEAGTKCARYARVHPR